MMVSIIVPCYNEEEALPYFMREIRRTEAELSAAYGCTFELLFVDDGSKDRTLEVLRSFAGDGVRYLSFSRNFGKEAAMYAGLQHARGEYVAIMDADLQHPPECVAQIIEKFEEGYEVINMVRTKNKSAGLIKNITSGGFYKVINTISDVKLEPNASDFFAMTANAAQVLKQSYREKVRFLRGYVQNIGFKRTNIEYEARARVAGESKYSLKKLFIFSVNTILCFSNMPLKLGIYAGILSGAAGMAVLVYSGIIVGLLGVFVMIYTIYGRVVHGAPSGYATIVVLLCFMFAMLFMLVGIIGEYIAILFTELKDRPIYIVKETQNIDGRKNPDGKNCVEER